LEYWWNPHFCIHFDQNKWIEQDWIEWIRRKRFWSSLLDLLLIETLEIVLYQMVFIIKELFGEETMDILRRFDS